MSFSESFKTHLTKTWWHLPLSREHKEWVKTLIFNLFPFLFRKSRVYNNWREARIFSNHTYGIISALDTDRFLKKVNPEFVEKFIPEAIRKEPITTIALIIHAFHFDVFQEITDYLNIDNEVKFRLYVTSPDYLTEKITGFLESRHFKFDFLPVENRGRDILSFLTIAPQALNDGHQVILKIHTKKSNHRRSGELWRKDLFYNLLREPALKNALRIFNTDHTVGLIGAPGHIVPMNLYYGANARMVETLSRAMGIHPSQLTNLNFPAGSMFYARKQALIPLLNLGLTSVDFEEETMQKDGTLAHAIERAFAVSSFAAGLKLVDTAYNTKRKNIDITKDHPFTH